MESRYVQSALRPEQLPKESLAEVALLGRSNCGKSTFINTLLNKKNLAKTSKFAGRTQTINFFDVDSKFYLVDIPGYGFSGSDSKLSKYWEDLVEAYLKRTNISYILFLQDIRRTLNDEDLWVLNHSLNCDNLFIILTKSDKLSRSNIIKTQASYEKILKDAHIKYDELIYYSAIKRTNLIDIQKKIFSEFGINYSF